MALTLSEVILDKLLTKQQITAIVLLNVKHNLYYLPEHYTMIFSHITLSNYKFIRYKDYTVGYRIEVLQLSGIL
jgi:hypothetical protein